MRAFRSAERTSGAAELELLHDGEVYRVQLRRVDTARRFILRVRGATRDAILTMPKRATLKDATEFAQRNAAWVGVRLRRLPQQVHFEHGALFPLRGRQTRIVHAPGVRGTVWLAGDDVGDETARLYVAGEAPHTERRVRDWLKNQARRELEAAVARYAQMIAKPLPSITLRDTTTRWGSCSTAGALNFSWRLIMAPTDVLTYLAAHEVCHLQHMNHSARFWKMCRSLCPHTDSAEQWLRSHGADLHRYGPKSRQGDSGSSITF
jgi:predicted metal-dependent hydrolase